MYGGGAGDAWGGVKEEKDKEEVRTVKINYI